MSIDPEIAVRVFGDGSVSREESLRAMGFTFDTTDLPADAQPCIKVPCPPFIEDRLTITEIFDQESWATESGCTCSEKGCA